MKKWIDLYEEEIAQEGGIEKYYINKITTKKRLIRLIVENLSEGDQVLEAGCGTGIITTYLASKGYNAIGIDIDSEILQLAQKISNIYSYSSKCCYKNQSIFDLNYPKDHFKVIFSSGVLEHFEDNEIIATLSMQLMCSRFVIVSIPTIYFNQDEAMHGDERFLPISKWHELIENSGGRIIREKGYHFLKFPYNFFDFRRYLKGYPYQIFLIEKI